MITIVKMQFIPDYVVALVVLGKYGQNLTIRDIGLPDIKWCAQTGSEVGELDKYKICIILFVSHSIYVTSLTQANIFLTTVVHKLCK